nr:MAG TPA: hypothetical protein [Caudoviricetes sp.]
MIIETKLADGTTEMFHTKTYKISRSIDFHPMILSVHVYSENGTLLEKRKRPFSTIYKHITFKSEKVQNELKKIQEQSMAETIRNNSVEVKE